MAAVQLLQDSRLYNNLIQEIGMLSLVRKGAWTYDSEYQPDPSVSTLAVRLVPTVVKEGTLQVCL